MKYWKPKPNEPSIALRLIKCPSVTRDTCLAALGNNVMIEVVVETQWHVCGQIFKR